MTETVDSLAARLRAEGEAVQAFFAGLAPGDWQRVVYSEGAAWRARDLLAHFIAAEQGFQRLLEDVAAGGAGAPPGFDVDGYNRDSVGALREQEPAVLLGQFAMVRERSAALVARLRPEQLENRGRHPALGETTLTEMARVIYNHNKLHLRDLRRALSAPETGGLEAGGLEAGGWDAGGAAG